MAGLYLWRRNMDNDKEKKWLISCRDAGLGYENKAVLDKLFFMPIIDMANPDAMTMVEEYIKNMLA